MLKDNVGTSVNGCKRLQRNGSRKEIGTFLCRGKERNVPAGYGSVLSNQRGEERGCGWDRLDSGAGAQGSASNVPLNSL